VFVVLIALLNIVRTDLASRGHVLSKCPLGPTGRTTTLAFQALAAPFASLLHAPRPPLPGWRRAAGMVALGFTAIGAALGGLVPMRPCGHTMDQPSTSAQVRNLGLILRWAGAMLAITFIKWALAGSPSLSRCGRSRWRFRAAAHERDDLKGPRVLSLPGTATTCFFVDGSRRKS
jgi:hypothetical protein